MKKPAPTPTPEAVPVNNTTDQDVINTLQSCDRRMKDQHNFIQQLSPKAQAWDVLCTVVEAMRPGQPYGADDLPSRMFDACAMLQERVEKSK